MHTNGVALPNRHVADMEQGYKYLGALQSYDTNDAEVREKAGIEYKKRGRQVLRSHLNGRNKIAAIKAYAIPVIRYSAGISIWPTEEVK